MNYRGFGPSIEPWLQEPWLTIGREQGIDPYEAWKQGAAPERPFAPPSLLPPSNPFTPRDYAPQPPPQGPDGRPYKPPPNFGDIDIGSPLPPQLPPSYAPTPMPVPRFPIPPSGRPPNNFTPMPVPPGAFPGQPRPPSRKPFPSLPYQGGSMPFTNFLRNRF